MKTVEQILELIENGTWVRTEELGETETSFFKGGAWHFTGWQGATYACEDVTITHCEGFSASYIEGEENVEIKRYRLEGFDTMLQVTVAGKIFEIPGAQFFDVLHMVEDALAFEYDKEIHTQIVNKENL